MRTIIFIVQIIAYLFFPYYLFGQEQNTTEKYSFDIIEGDTIYFNADTLASFPSGENGLRKHIALEFKNPYSKDDDVFDDYNFKCGLAFVRFIVTKTGDIENIQLVRPKAKQYEDECIRVTETFPKFIPAKINNIPVNSWFTVTFRLHID